MTHISKYHKPAFFLTVLILFAAVTLLTWGETAASPQGSFLTAVQMTDHALTGEDTMYIGGSLHVKMGTNSAHVIWREQKTANNGTDLFYRSLPNGTTQRLSDTASAKNVGVFFPALYISDTNTPHVIWEEYTSAVDSRDINYWNPNDGLVTLVSQTPTTGFNTFRPVLWLEGDEAHIVWQQRNVAQTEDIYMYWNSISQTALELPGFEAGLIHEGVLHITWESSFNGPVNYWNSNTQSIFILPNSATIGDASVHQRGIFADASGQITIFYGHSGYTDPATTCLASWNNATQTTTIHVTGNKCFSVAPVQRDNQGVYHTYAVDSNSGFLPYYWNSTLTDAIFFDVSGAGTGFGIPGGDLYLADNGKVHIVWEDDDDLFYWNPDDQQVINLSESSGPNSQIADYFMFTSFDSSGNLTIIWQEQASSVSATGPFYWQSEEKITTNLLTKLGMSDIDEQSLAYANTPEPVYLFYGVPIVGDAGAFYWNIAEDTVTPVWTGGVTNTFFWYREGLEDEIFTAWVDQTTSSLTVNSTAKGSQIMSQTAADETDNLAYVLATDDFGNAYLIWTEMSDSAGEGLDFFAAWTTEFVEGSAKLYLPLVTR